MSHKTVGPLLEKEVTRKQFIYMIGLGVMGITGFSTVVDMLTGQGSNKTSTNNGFGSGLYGGNNAKLEVPQQDRNKSIPGVTTLIR